MTELVICDDIDSSREESLSDIKETTKNKKINVIVSDNANSFKQSEENKKKRNEKKIIYHFFIESKDYVEDPFWKECLDKAGRGIFPKGFSYENGYLIHKVKNKINKTKLSEDPKTLADICIEEFRKIRGMISNIDRNEAIKFFEKHMEIDINQFKWKNMKNCHKKQLIANYIDNKKNSQNLSDYATRSLTNNIKLGLFMNWLTEEHIKIDNFNIVDIENIIYDEKTDLFSIENKVNENKKSNVRKKSTAKPNHEGKLWKEYLNFFYGNNKVKFDIEYDDDGELILKKKDVKKGKRVSKEKSTETKKKKIKEEEEEEEEEEEDEDYDSEDDDEIF